jgi:hypothetical protein
MDKVQNPSNPKNIYPNQINVQWTIDKFSKSNKCVHHMMSVTSESNQYESHFFHLQFHVQDGDKCSSDMAVSTYQITGNKMQMTTVRIFILMKLL